MTTTTTLPINPTWVVCTPCGGPIDHYRFDHPNGTKVLICTICGTTNTVQVPRGVR